MKGNCWQMLLLVGGVLLVSSITTMTTAAGITPAVCDLNDDDEHTQSNQTKLIMIIAFEQHAHYYQYVQLL